MFFVDSSRFHRHFLLIARSSNDRVPSLLQASVFTKEVRHRPAFSHSLCRTDRSEASEPKDESIHKAKEYS